MRIAIALAVGGQLGFAAKAIFIKLAYRAQPSLDAITLLTWRMLASLPLFLLLAWWARRAGERGAPSPITRHDWLRILFLGFIGYYLASFLDFWGLQFISAALERLILFVNPTLVALISWAWLKKPITRKHAIALALTYAGIVLAYAHDFQIASDRSALYAGSALVFASALAYALYLVMSAEITKRVNSARFTAYMMCVSTGFVVGHFFHGVAGMDDCRSVKAARRKPSIGVRHHWPGIHHCIGRDVLGRECLIHAVSWRGAHRVRCAANEQEVTRRGAR
jgi:drug/metabolite transporter (DMT)-like permease